MTTWGSRAANDSIETFLTSLGYRTLPGDAVGVLTNDGAGALSWVPAGTPGAHAASHQNGGGDELNVGGLNGVLADPQPPIIGAGAAQAVAGNDSRLTDSRTPTAHKTSHEDGGGDEISLAGLSGVGADMPPSTRAINNGFGITGGGSLAADRTLAVALTSSSAFATAETTIAAATYADITGVSLTLAAGTWLILGQVNIRFVNAIVQAFVAITGAADAVISEVAASRPASGTASLNSPFSAFVAAIVSPASSTTYKLRGARGLTTHTGSWTAMDGNGVNTANHASNNSDKGTGIFAIRIA